MSETKENLNLDSVISCCENCNEPIIFNEFIKTWRHDRPLAFFDNGHYCDNTIRDVDKYAEKGNDL